MTAARSGRRSRSGTLPETSVIPGSPLSIGITEWYSEVEEGRQQANRLLFDQSGLPGSVPLQLVIDPVQEEEVADH